MKNEDPATTAVEYETRKIPSLGLFGLSVGAMIVSAGLMLLGDKKWQRWALFFGQWVPSILVMGTYNKLAKTFSAPIDEEERIKHGDHAAPRISQRPERVQPATH